MHDKYGNEVLKIDGKWKIHQPLIGLPYATRYDEGRYDLDNIHYAMMHKIDELNKILDELCEPF